MPSMMGYARSTIDVAPAPLRGGGIISVANVIDVPAGSHALLGAEYLNDACAEARIWLEFCAGATIPAQCTDPGAPDPELTKNFDGDIDLVVGDPFAVYAGVSCGLQRIDEAEARARRRLEANESAQIDGYIWKALLAPGAAAPHPDVTGVVDVCEAAGAIEEIQSTFYGGETTLLVPRQFINCMARCGYIARDLDGSLRTLTGALVAPVTRPLTDDTIDPANKTGRIYGTGRITLVRGPIDTKSVGPMVRQDGSCEPARALAERVVVPLIECGAVMIEVTCCCGEAAP